MFGACTGQLLATMSERADTPLVNWSELGVSGLLPTGTVTLLLEQTSSAARGCGGANPTK